ncbi:MAG: hypothetical protein IPK80_17305 [Nannocystis sp.]|nr:hypothetical protein [Nannocystis sp.]
MATRSLRILALAASLVGLGALACSSQEEPWGSTPRAEVDGEVGRLARIHVALQPWPDVVGGDPQLDVRARFAAFRGLEVEVVRARLGLGPLPHERVGVGSCVIADHVDGLAEVEPRPQRAERELLLLDGGDLQLRVGGVELAVPLVLVPDLLPYMSGVEYELVVPSLPSVFALDERALIELELGGGDEELPPSQIKAALPARIDLRAEAMSGPSLVDLSWSPDPRGAKDAPLLLRLGAYIGGEAIGHEVLCAVVDRGALRLDVEELRRLGLGGAGEGLRIVASRTRTSTFEVGEFSGGELILEMRDGAFVTLP